MKKEHLSAEEILEQRRQRFVKKYKEAFGIELTLDKLPKESNEPFVLHYYGIKSPWM